MRCFEQAAVGTVSGVDLPVEGAVRELAATVDAGASTASGLGARFEGLEAATELRERASAVPAEVRPVVPTLERTLRTAGREGGDATVTDLYVAGVRERRREVVAATVASVAGPALVGGYEASACSLRDLVAAVSAALAATSAPVVREHCLRALAALARARPAVVRATLDAEAVLAAVQWLYATDSALRHQADAVTELLVVTLPRYPSVWDETPLPAVTEELLAGETATTRAFAEVLRLRAPESVDASSGDSSGGQSFTALERLAASESGDDHQPLDDADSLEDGERRELARAVGRCVALAPELVADPPRSLVARVREAPQDDRAAAATALGEVVAHAIGDRERLENTLFNQFQAARGDGRDRRVRVLGEVAVACPDRLSWVPERFCEHVAAAAPPSSNAMRAVGECVVAATDGVDDIRAMDALRGRACGETGQTAELAAVALGEWVAHVPAAVDARVDSLAADVRAASDGERSDAAAVLGTYAIVEAERVDAKAVLDDSGSGRAARVRGERVLAGGIDGIRLAAGTRTRIRASRGRTRRFATRALGVAVDVGASSGASARASPEDALREAVAASSLAERPTRLRLLGEWVAVTVASDRTDGKTGRALSRRVRETTGTDRERAARALGLATMESEGAGDGRYGGVVAAVVARLRGHAEVVAATRRAVSRATAPVNASGASLPAGVPTGGRDWPVRALGELVAVAPGPTPQGAGSLAATVKASSGWNRQSGARALGATVLLDVHGPAGLQTVMGTGLSTAVTDRGVSTYLLGEVAAAHPETFPGIPDALVASVRDASGTMRTTTARALGEYVRQPSLEDPGSVRALETAVTGASGDAREPLARALGEVLAAVPDADTDLPGPLVDTVAAATGQDRRALARLLGELAVSDDPSDVLDRVAPTGDDAHVFERARRSRMVKALATTGTVDRHDLLEAVSITDPSADPHSATAGGLQDVEALLDAPAPIRDPLLDALTTTLDRDEATAPDDLDGRLDAWLRDTTDADPLARLHAIAARSTLDTTAACIDP